jgi:hypothetical protein
MEANDRNVPFHRKGNSYREANVNLQLRGETLTLFSQVQANPK